MSEFERKLREKTAQENERMRAAEASRREADIVYERMKKEEAKGAIQQEQDLNRRFEELRRVLVSLGVDEMLRTIKRTRQYLYRDKKLSYDGPHVGKHSPRLQKVTKSFLFGYGQTEEEKFNPQTDPDSSVTTSLYLTKKKRELTGSYHPESGPGPMHSRETIEKIGVYAIYPSPLRSPQRIVIRTTGLEVEYDPNNKSEIKTQIEDALLRQV